MERVILKGRRALDNVGLEYYDIWPLSDRIVGYPGTIIEEIETLPNGATQRSIKRQLDDGHEVLIYQGSGIE